MLTITLSANIQTQCPPKAPVEGFFLRRVHFILAIHDLHHAHVGLPNR